MTDISITVCAHHSRTGQAHTLASQLGADIVIDDGSHGSTANHAHAWARALHNSTTDTEWVGVCEDDAQPIPDILTHLPKMLAKSPTGLVSGYLGTGRPPKYQTSIQAALEGKPRWVLSTELLHHVAVFARRQHVPAMIDYLHSTRLPCDEALGVWARAERIPVAYPVPSLFDHEDGPPAITERAQPIQEPRKAWHVGTSDTWNGPIALLDRQTHNYYGDRHGQTQRT